MTNTEMSTDPELRKIQLETAATELRIKQAELHQKERESEPRSWVATGMRNPLIVGAAIAALATVCASGVTSFSAYHQLQADMRNKQAQVDLERIKAQIQFELDHTRYEASLITGAVQHGGGNPYQVTENLNFLLQAGLISRPETKEKLRSYLSSRSPGEGHRVPSNAGASQ